MDRPAAADGVRRRRSGWTNALQRSTLVFYLPRAGSAGFRCAYLESAIQRRTTCLRLVWRLDRTWLCVSALYVDGVEP